MNANADFDTDRETTAASQGVNELITTTFDMLTKFGSLRRLWTAAQQQSADLKRDGNLLIFDLIRTWKKH